jgi:hypothetical protein
MSRFNIEILLGTILILLTAVTDHLWLNEQNRMALAAEEQQAQAIEVGATIPK